MLKGRFLINGQEIYGKGNVNDFDFLNLRKINIRLYTLRLTEFVKRKFESKKKVNVLNYRLKG